MQIATFLETARERILEEAVAFARTIPSLKSTSEKTLRDHLPEVLRAISADLRTEQTVSQAIAKSQGRAAAATDRSSAQTHGLMRAQDGINVEQLIAEFRALRSSVLRLWAEAHPVGPHAIDDITRFNEAIDQAVAESVEFHANERERWRQIFLSVLGHDLRGPLQAVAMTVDMMRRHQDASPAHIGMLSRGVGRMTSLLDSLLEYNRANLGAGMSVQLQHVDLAEAFAEELGLLRTAHPKAQIEFESAGKTDGEFDASKLREALSNLVANAVKHGAPPASIHVRLRGNGQSVHIEVENLGHIPAGDIEGLFEPLRRRESARAGGDRTHLGLGLFIVRQIAKAHGGNVVGKCADDTVIFTMELPRR